VRLGEVFPSPIPTWQYETGVRLNLCGQNKRTGKISLGGPTLEMTIVKTFKGARIIYRRYYFSKGRRFLQYHDSKELKKDELSAGFGIGIQQDVAIPGLLVRRGSILEMVCFGQSKEGNPKVSIEITEEIKEAVTNLILKLRA